MFEPASNLMEVDFRAQLLMWIWKKNHPVMWLSRGHASDFDQLVNQQQLYLTSLMVSLSYEVELFFWIGEGGK